jgi:ABC-type lipoprotein release transport system permease subunit
MAPVLARLLSGVTPTDAVTLTGGVSLLLVVIAVAACTVPARRAARIQPLEAIRE